MVLFLNWRGNGTTVSLFESSFDGPTDDPPFSNGAEISGRGSITGPSVANYDGVRYMAWRGIAGDQTLYFAIDDGSGWTSQTPLPNMRSANSPALATYGETPLCDLARRGRPPATVVVDTGPDPESSVVGPATVHRRPGFVQRPGPDRVEGLLFMAWRGVEGDQTIWWSTADGQGWADQAQLPDQVSVDGPALVAFGTNLYLFSRGGSDIDISDKQLYVSTFQGINLEPAWSPRQLVINTNGRKIGSDSRPGLAPFNGQLFIASVGTETSSVIPNPGSGGDPGLPESPDDVQIYIETFDGTDTVGHVPTPQQTDYQPSLSRFQEDHYAGISERH